MPEITRHQTNTVHGLLRQADELELSDPLAWSMLGKYLEEMTAIQEAVCRAIENERFERSMHRLDGLVESANAAGKEYKPIPRALDQEDFAGAPEGPANHPVFGLLTRQFMAPQQVRR